MEIQELRGILSNNIKNCRERDKLTQADLAEKLDKSTNFISDIESGKSWISITTLVKLATVFNVEPYELLKADAFFSEKEKTVLDSYLEENKKAVLSVVNRMRLE